MKKIFALLTFLILVGIFIPTVSAEIIIDDSLQDFEFTGTSGVASSGSGDIGSTARDVSSIYIYNTENIQNLYYIAFIKNAEAGWSYPSEGDHAITYTYNGVTKPGNMHVTHIKNYLGTVTSISTTLFFDDWDSAGKTGTQKIKLSKSMFSVKTRTGGGDVSGVGRLFYDCFGGYSPYYAYTTGYSLTICSDIDRRAELLVEDDGNTYTVNIVREINGIDYISTLNLNKESATIISDTANKNKKFTLIHSQIDEIEILLGGVPYTWPLSSGGESPGSSAVTVYVRNSQTNALLANAHINISASVNGNLHEIVNETVPSGIYSIDLQPTGGGLPNPDFYRLIVTAEGYNSIMPYIDFEVDGATSIYAYLDPIGGAPEDENNTFIDFYVRDMSANPISGATVNFGGYTLISNSAGYTIFEVDKSKTYSWTVSKSGYGSLTGNAIIGSNARHTINTVLAPAVTPTTPTAIPTSTSISPTPTMTAPTGEPVNNWLEWFAAHFGMILGGGAEIGKIFMWLCFAVPVGVYVGKEAKAGAAGFMAGAGVVTLFFVLIGWVPIWLLVFIALIIGLLYAKIFNNSDNGGGR